MQAGNTSGASGYMHYRNSTLGTTLMDALDEMIHTAQIQPAVANRLLEHVRASALWNMAATVAGSVVGADAANAKEGENAVVAPADTPIPAASMKAYATMLAQWRFQHASQSLQSPASPLAVPQPPLRSTFYPLPSDTEESAPVVPSRALAQAHVALSAPVHVYAATLRVDAQFYGLRYLMYYWFFTSASIGVGILMVWEYVALAK
ncbi:hypothetical protein AMAG_19765 [Allomyces macrogynus ATCC 38327]|uniref:Transcription initiation factor IIA gamma subunit N-terminal domain-containing protein n=1 Tax=Allomyces macrogynus (strain ATCC 38327) TaxID=578462 RepID=A0A0L0T1X5_ALLM3|nr:hypothetical protein AMAG_19765 [Allomyces macrogynus ATCC 38327]|eukprot:KNE68625.1 hypothetical protein AMAG_19765 [Allomyces macrogynus ATCC 38327]